MKNWRGRRLRACRACDDLAEIIKNLGVEEDPTILPPHTGFPLPMTEQMKAELQNMAANLLRMILIQNDGHVSPRVLPRF
jgi:hypothetical protein